MKKIILILIMLSSTVWAKEESKGQKTKPSEVFSDSEENFKLTMQKILERYIDKTINKNDLYRAATAGMLTSLNSGNEAWNELLSPAEMKELKIDLSGKVTGVGLEMKFDEHTGFAQVLRVIPGSSADKSGLKIDDQILNVDGKKFKGKTFQELVSAVRGEVNKSVILKVLREDKIVIFNIKREILSWTPVDLEILNESTALLSIRFFNNETPALVEEKINVITLKKITKLILDVRDNSGGSFDQAIKVSELFLPKGTVIASTKNRDGKVEQYKSTRGLLNSNIKIVLLTNKETFCGAELFTAALKENKKIKIVGESTFGKWNAQTVEPLSNKYAIKYTVKEFQSSLGNSYQGIGIKPDMEVSLPEGVQSRDLRLRYDIEKRMNFDPQLKAASEMISTL